MKKELQLNAPLSPPPPSPTLCFVEGKRIGRKYCTKVSHGDGVWLRLCGGGGSGGGGSGGGAAGAAAAGAAVIMGKFDTKNFCRVQTKLGT